jgi:hypothetical protein
VPAPTGVKAPHHQLPAAVRQEPLWHSVSLLVLVLLVVVPGEGRGMTCHPLHSLSCHLQQRQNNGCSSSSSSSQACDDIDIDSSISCKTMLHT